MKNPSFFHVKKLKGYKEKFRPVWHFFDIKGYCIMAVMMGEESGFVVPDCYRIYSLQCFIPDLDVR